MNPPLTALRGTSQIVALARVEPESGETAGEAFGAFLKRELRARKWSVRYLALRSGLNHSTVSRLLQGSRTPTLQTASRLVDALAARDRIAPVKMPARPAGDPIRRVADALAADPQLTAAHVDQVLRYYEELRVSRRVPVPSAELRPAAASVRRIAGGRQAG